jgi:hypothetical protein
MADVVIRIGDLCGALAVSHVDWFALDCADLGGWSDARINDRSAPEINRWMLRIRKSIDRATECARVDDWSSFTAHLSVAVNNIATVCAGLGVNLPETITAKMAYNKTRTHRHGNKQA